MEKENRQKLIEERIRKKEVEAERTLETIKEIIRDILFSKGYTAEEIEEDKPFYIELDGEKTPVSVDFIIKIKNKRFLSIKCSPGALDSRQRHVVAFSRVVDTHQIPFAVVTDGLSALLFDTITGKLIKEGIESMPTFEEAKEMVRHLKFESFPEERLEREKRVLLAFEAIKCSEEFCE